MHDCLHLALADRAAVIGSDDHRRLGLGTISHESTLSRQCKMNSCVLNRIDTPDALRQFLFDGSVVTRLLHELACAERHIVLQAGESGSGLTRQPCRRQHDARFVKFARWNLQSPRQGIEGHIDTVLGQQLLSLLFIGVRHAGV